MGDEDVDDGFEDDRVRGRGPRDSVHRLEDGDGLVEVFGDAAIGVDEGGEVRASQFDRHVILQFVEDVFHCLEVDGLNGTVGIDEKLVKYEIKSKKRRGKDDHQAYLVSMRRRLDTRLSHLFVVMQSARPVRFRCRMELHYRIVRGYPGFEILRMSHFLEKQLGTPHIPNSRTGTNDGSIRNRRRRNAASFHLLEQFERIICFAGLAELRNDVVIQIQIHPDAPL